ncbi:spheroidene monooxygenase [Parasediminibacterium sp. JCM 36343]|uniref:spheroidene monooxygenase n=1 Tax=Parasediminibacterium sp. JCM 36343 TaxID=3374279 RepID=UPI00397D3004
MICTLTIARYPRYMGFVGIFSMAIFHIPLFINKQISFYKLMGCGKNGSFDKTPDWRQWAVLSVYPSTSTPTPIPIPAFLKQWYRFFNAEVFTIWLQPIEGHGTWDSKEAFGKLPKQTDYNGPIAVLTRATIRLGKLSSFWKNTPAVSHQLKDADGLIASVGIGEIPFIKQATFSIWESKAHMKSFAYNMKAHTQVIRKTKQEDWYSEDMFTRFIPLSSKGFLNGKQVIAEKA